MAAAEIVFEVLDTGELLAVLADAVVSETHRMSGVATEQEVEVGVRITDHYRRDRDTLSLEVVFSDTPLDALEGRDGEFWFGVEGSVRSADISMPDRLVTTRLASGKSPARGVETEKQGTPALTASFFQVDGGPITRTVDNWALLQSARDGAYLAIIRTGLRTYEDMVLLSAETTREAKDGTWIVCQLEFAQITQVATELVDVPVTAPRNRRTADQGAQATDGEEQSSQSLAYQGGVELLSFLRGGG